MDKRLIGMTMEEQLEAALEKCKTQQKTIDALNKAIKTQDDTIAKLKQETVQIAQKATNAAMASSANTSLHARLNAITDPRQQQQFLRSLTPEEHKALFAGI